MNIYPFMPDKEEIIPFLEKLLVSSSGISIMKNRFETVSFVVSDLKTPAANIIKQHILSLGGEAAVPRHAVNCSKEKSDIIFTLRKDKFPQFISRCREQCWSLPELADFIEKYLSYDLPWFSFSHKSIKNSGKPAIMGILNVTPDSFSDGGSYTTIESALNHAEKMIFDGAAIIDVGGESTRPGSLRVDVEEEIKRTSPVIKIIKDKFPEIPVSIDTVNLKTAEKALDSGAEIINDISGFSFDPDMAKLAAERKSVVILMHIKGTPQNMQNNPQYDDIIGEINDFFKKQIDWALKCGVKENSIILDPGIGFGKTVEHNLYIIKHLEAFTGFGFPILVGASRKSFIGKITQRENPIERGFGTEVINAIALQKNAAILRVHDVKAALDTIKIIDAIKDAKCL